MADTDPHTLAVKIHCLTKLVEDGMKTRERLEYLEGTLTSKPSKRLRPRLDSMYPRFPLQTARILVDLG